MAALSPPTGDDLERRALARVGRILNEKYALERLLGYGGMAAVYAARHRNGHRAAVKILHPEIARDEEVRTRFLHEGYAANKVEHPGAVSVMDDDVVNGGEDKGAAYLVMELLEGESVFTRVKRSGTLPAADVLAITEGVLDVLDAAHTRGIVHRDLKPDNLFLVRPPGEERERVKVLDFGIARIADVARRTNIGQALGTPSYMSPEQARGQRELIDGRSDLFSLGATMFRLLTGRRIHDAETGTEILAKMATLPAPPLRSIAPSTSPAIAAIIDRALQFEREQRYGSAAEMRADVRAARAGQPLPSADFAPIGFSSGAEPTSMPTAPELATVAGTAPGLPPTTSHASPPASTQPLVPTVSNHAPPVGFVAQQPTVSQHAPVVFASPPPSRANGAPVAIFAVAGAALLLLVGGALFYVLGSSSPSEPKTISEPHPGELENDEKPSADKSADPRPILPTPEAPESTTATPTPKPAQKPIAKPTTGAKPTASVAPAKSAPAPTVVPKLAPIPAAPAPTPTPTQSPPPPTGPGNGNGKAKGKDK